MNAEVPTTAVDDDPLLRAASAATANAWLVRWRFRDIVVAHQGHKRLPHQYSSAVCAICPLLGSFLFAPGTGASAACPLAARPRFIRSLSRNAPRHSWKHRQHSPSSAPLAKRDKLCQPLDTAGQLAQGCPALLRGRLFASWRGVVDSVGTRMRTAIAITCAVAVGGAEAIVAGEEADEVVYASPGRVGLLCMSSTLSQCGPIQRQCLPQARALLIVCSSTMCNALFNAGKQSASSSKSVAVTLLLG